MAGKAVGRMKLGGTLRARASLALVIAIIATVLPSDEGMSTGGPLFVGSGGRAEFNIPVGEIAAYGHVHLTNEGSVPIVFRSLEVLDIEGGIDVVWLGLNLDDDVPTPGVVSWPPHFVERMVDDVRGVILEPGDDADVVTGIRRTSAQHGRVSSLLLRYTVGGVNFEQIVEVDFSTNSGLPMRPGD